MRYLVIVLCLVFIGCTDKHPKEKILVSAKITKSNLLGQEKSEEGWFEADILERKGTFAKLRVHSDDETKETWVNLEDIVYK